MSDKDVEILKRIVTEQKDSIQEILGLLNSNDKTKRMGLVEKLDTLDTKFTLFLNSYNTTEAVKAGKLGLIATLGAAAALIIQWLIRIFA